MPNFLVTAIVCDPKGNHPLFGDEYFKIAYHSESPDIRIAYDKLSAEYRVLSVKSRPITEADLNELADRQGNQLIVDGKRVYTEGNE